MEKSLKTRLLCYLVISAVSFAYLILPQKAGISVPVFIIIQFICLFFIVPKRKPLLIFIPIFILALNSFISDNNIWHVSNFIVTIILYGTMVLLMTKSFSFVETSIRFLFEIIRNIFMPLSFFDVPLKWAKDSNKAQLTLIKRILVGVIIAIPCLIILVAVLSSADQIFSKGVVSGLRYLQTVFNLTLIFKIVCGIVVGFYLFGLTYYMYQPKQAMTVKSACKSGDLIIINIVLFSILCVYTIFSIIQFRYLFASSGHLPYGLTYTYYARRGFFELLFLSAINICIILLILKLAQKHMGFWLQLTKGFCGYLCIMTFILLVSSFYRMWLYNLDGGLTRLRFLVLGFLIFEAVGLVFTLIYIIKPKFNLIATYLLIGLFYYLLLNLIPLDGIIAKNQIERYLATGKGDLKYTLSLSVDAAPQIAWLLNHTDYSVRADVERYFDRQNKKLDSQISSWRGFNLSLAKFRQIVDATDNVSSKAKNLKMISSPRPQIAEPEVSDVSLVVEAPAHLKSAGEEYPSPGEVNHILDESINRDVFTPMEVERSAPDISVGFERGSIEPKAMAAPLVLEKLTPWQPEDEVYHSPHEEGVAVSELLPLDIER